MLALAAATASAAEIKPPPKNVKPPPPPLKPRHDPPDMPFRCAPMGAAVRSLHIPVSETLHVAFDSELLRTHVVWHGKTLNLWGTAYHERKDRFYCDFEGETLFTMPPVFPWAVGKQPGLPASIPDMRSRFLGVGVSNGVTLLRYEVGLPDGKAVAVSESFRPMGALGWDITPTVIRRLEVEACEHDLWFLAAVAPAHRVRSGGPNAFVILEGETNSIGVIALSMPILRPFALNSDYSFDETRWVEAKNDSERQRRAVSGPHGFAWFCIPAYPGRRSVEIAVCVGTDDAATSQGINGWAISRAQRWVDNPAGLVKQTAPPAKVVSAPPSPVIPAGNAHYRLERFALPPEIDLQVTGLDFLPNGDAIACTWSGEVYVVEGATGSPAKARYRRFARGLCEPGGLRVVEGEVYIVQKHELTRLRDTDGNGEADQFDCINNRWGFTGNYHDFTFGPTIDGQGRWHIFRNGNRGHYDVPFMGWDIVVGFDGRTVTPFCAGLRSPNGFGTFQGDVFMTENQGNWMGSGKLNHFQQGRFYGYPSTTPADKAEQFDAPTKFDPPAVWFPYNLSRSASGIAVIGDERFGPFTGQMLVGEFQNATVTRVFLEKVEGEWQGCVWPFAKGFNSGVNRLAFGPDGKLYVGGVKNAAWSAVAPKNWSLDRVSFTGNVPFEVKAVRAKPDGFELEFTRAVDRESAGDAGNYDVAQYRYEYHQAYGSPEFDFDGKPNSASEVRVAAASVSGDGLRVQLKLNGWRARYVTQFRLLDVADSEAKPLLNDTFHYTLNRIPAR